MSNEKICPICLDVLGNNVFIHKNGGELHPIHSECQLQYIEKYEELHGIINIPCVVCHSNLGLSHKNIYFSQLFLFGFYFFSIVATLIICKNL
jgi:hypothetical protein